MFESLVHFMELRMIDALNANISIQLRFIAVTRCRSPQHTEVSAINVLLEANPTSLAKIPVHHALSLA